MAITRVAGQQAHNSTASATSLTVTLASNPTLGNLVIAGFVGVGTTSPITGVADLNSNSYTPTSKTPAINTNVSGGIWASIHYLQNAPSNASSGVKMTISVAGPIVGFVAEYAGAAISGVFENDAVHTTNTSSTNINDPTLTTVNAGDLLFAVANPTQTISSANTPWSLVAAIDSADAAEDLIQTNAGAQAVSFTQAPAGLWCAIEAAFKAPARGGTLPLLGVG